MKINAKQQHGFTLVEVMIIVAIIGLIAAVAVPNFVHARTLSRKNTCIANLRQIENAKLVWAQQEQKAAADVPQPEDLFGSTMYLRCQPVCPSGGVYRLTEVDQPTECSLAIEEGHAL